MNLNLSEDIIKGLETLADEKLINDQVFNHILDSSFKVAVKNNLDSSVILESAVTKDVDAIALKQTFSSLLSFILETMKINSDLNSISGILDDHKFSESRIENILNYFKEHRVAIRKVLSITNFHFPHIIDVNWRLDYFMKSNSVEKLNTPVYLINLTTEQEEGVQPGKVEFACTLDQLQDLVYKLRDAQKQIERSAIKS
ncbi:COMM domain-containing protein 3 [Tieghemostelium lacteum]|uniref:COMM domain-containing protein 3 n=1 Tax=Tieghemostelium lacteum TaxID=361077 RepID=A0A152A4E2_TIELA|nr:COMM domain-containing protein 3 [Tieghemostelium lacteum]|eukprot:KYR01113.1 COMM domain-containing protein 3 [Tieghemostelium lacteum]